MRTVYIALVLTVLFGCSYADYSGDDGAAESTEHVTQSLSACLDGDGRNLTCTTGSTGRQCGGIGPDGGTCYCPEVSPTEQRYCDTRSYCSRPEYNSHCSGYCGGSPTFVHWCVSGAMPAVRPLP